MANDQTLEQRFKADSPMGKVWRILFDEVQLRTEAEPILTSFFHSIVLDHPHLGKVLTDLIALKLATEFTPSISLRRTLAAPFSDEKILLEASLDMIAYYLRDPACRYLSSPLLFYKGFQAVQAYRAAHYHWKNGRHSLALFLQSRISEVFGIDIHPAAKIGYGVMVDHGTGVVIGETAKVGNYVSIYHGVTLGWDAKSTGVRHPEIEDHVLLSAGCTILGNIKVHKYAQVAASSVVLQTVAEGMTVAGIPAKPVAGPTMQAWSDNVEFDYAVDPAKDRALKQLHDQLLVQVS